MVQRSWCQQDCSLVLHWTNVSAIEKFRQHIKECTFVQRTAELWISCPRDAVGAKSWADIHSSLGSVMRSKIISGCQAQGYKPWVRRSWSLQLWEAGSCVQSCACVYSVPRPRAAISCRRWPVGLPCRAGPLGRDSLSNFLLRRSWLFIRGYGGTRGWKESCLIWSEEEPTTGASLCWECEGGKILLGTGCGHMARCDSEIQ